MYQQHVRPRILVVDEDRQLLQWMHKVLNGHAFHPLLATPDSAVTALAQSLRPHAILIGFDEIPSKAWSLVRPLHRNPRTTAIPLIVYGPIPHTLAFSMVLKLYGIRCVLSRPPNERLLIETIRRLLTAEHTMRSNDPARMTASDMHETRLRHSSPH